MRKVDFARKTSETDIKGSLNLDGKGLYDIETGCGFFNHMMELFAKYMSIGINNLINTCDTDLSVLNSSFSNFMPDINSRIIEYLSSHQNLV